MKSPIQRRVAIAALLLAPALTACGFSEQTDQVYQPAVGVNDRSDTVYVLSARPARVVEVVDVPFARPRETTVVDQPDFVRLRRHITELLDTAEDLTPESRP